MLVKPRPETPLTPAASGCTSVFSDANDRSEIILPVPSVTATSVGIAHLVIEHPSSSWFHQGADGVI